MRVPVGPVLVAAPPIIILILGAEKLRDAIEILLAPDAPVRFALTTRDGPVKVRIDRYHLDPARDRYVFRGVSVSAPGGTGGRLKEARVEGWDWRKGLTQRVDVRLEGLRARLVRRADGEFEILRLLPESQGPPSDIPFRVTARDNALTILDLKGGRRVARVSSPLITVSGVRERLVAGGRLDFGALGAARLALGRAEQRFQTEIQGERIALKPTLALLKLIPETSRALRDVRVAEGVASGRLKAEWGFGNPVATGEFRVTATRIGYRDLPLVAGTVAARLSGGGGTGTFDLTSEGVRARGLAAGVWPQNRPLDLAVRGFVAAPTIPSRWRDRLPKGLIAQGGEFRGGAAYQGTTLRFAGDATLAGVRYQGREARNVRGRIAFDGRAVAWRDVFATLDGLPARSRGGSLDTRTRVLTADVALPRTRLSTLLALFPERPNVSLAGATDVQALVTGRTDAPSVAFRATGDPTYRTGRLTLSGAASLDGVFAKGRVQTLSGVLTTDRGGIVVVPDGDDLLVRSAGVSLRGLSPEVERGTLVLDGRLSGLTRGQPRFQGFAELYDARIQGRTIAFARSKVDASPRSVVVNDLFAQIGTSTARGSGRIDLATRRIAGRLAVNGIQLGDYVSEDLLGGVDIPQVVVAGTLDRPLARAVLRGDGLVVGNVGLTGIRATGSLEGRTFVGDLSGLAADGPVDGSLRYDLDTRSGSARFTLKSADLATATLGFAETASLTGKLSGQGTATIRDGTISAADVTLDLLDVFANGTAVGSGSIKGRLRGDQITGEGSVGSPERYAQLENFRARLDRKRANPVVEASGTLLASRIDVPDFARGLVRYLPRNNVRLREDVLAAKGDVSFGLRFSGSPSSPSFAIDSLVAENLAYRSLELGTLTAKGSRIARDWTIEELNLDGPAGKLSAKGTVEEGGETALDVEGQNVRLGNLGAILPTFARVRGNSFFSLRLDGETAAPNVRGTADVRGLFAADETPERGLSASVAVDLSDAGRKGQGLNLEGSFAYTGFQGTVNVKAPIVYNDPFRIDLPLNGALVFRERPLRDIMSGLGAFDAEKSEGVVAGRVDVGGTWGDPNLSGALRLNGGAFALASVPGLGEVGTSLKGIDAELLFDRDAATLKASADSTRGGNLALSARTLRGSQGLLTDLGRNPLENLLATPVLGGMTLNGLHARQNFEGDTYVDATLDGPLSLAGTLGRPKIAGALSVPQFDTVVPTFALSDSAGGVPTIIPTFDIKATLTNPARVRASALDTTIGGGLSVQGPLTALRVDAGFDVQSGRLRLPGGVVRLTPGGDIAFAYRGGGDASLRVDIEGRTALTARDAAQRITRYDVDLVVRGNVLSDQGLSYSATTDPGGLSSERVLALLTRTDLAALATTGGSGAENALRNALAGYALPLVLDPVTSRLATGLGLDYVSLDYDPFGRTNLALAKTLGLGFSVVGTRQLSPAPPGFVQPYDIRLVFRPRRVPGLFRNLSIFLGADELRPWRFGVDYAGTFGTFRNLNRPERRVIISRDPDDVTTTEKPPPLSRQGD